MLQHATPTLVQDDEPSHVMVEGLESWISVLLISQSGGCRARYAGKLPALKLVLLNGAARIANGIGLRADASLMNKAKEVVCRRLFFNEATSFNLQHHRQGKEVRRRSKLGLQRAVVLRNEGKAG